MVPVIDFLQEKLAYLFDWYEENSRSSSLPGRISRQRSSGSSTP